MDWLRELPWQVFWFGWGMVALLVGGSLNDVWWAKRNAKAIGAQTPVNVSDLGAGYRMAWGTTVGPDLTAPLTGRPCVWWKVQVWESVRESRPGKAGIGPDATRWIWREAVSEESDRSLLFGGGWRHRLRASLVAGLLLPVMGGTVAAAELPPAICAVEQAIGCEPYAPCERNLPAAINLPTLMRIDPVGRVVISRSQTGEERRSEIVSITTLETMAILQGVDGGSAWSMHVDLGNGRFSLTSARRDEAFIAFGSCSAKILE